MGGIDGLASEVVVELYRAWRIPPQLPCRRLGIGHTAVVVDPGGFVLVSDIGNITKIHLGSCAVAGGRSVGLRISETRKPR